MNDENDIDVVTGEQVDEIEEKDVTGEELLSNKSKRQMTPEYKAELVERLKKARETKKKANQLGVAPKRRIKPDADQGKLYFCDICKRSYKTNETLVKHNKRFHKEKLLSNIVMDKEKSNNKLKEDAAQKQKKAEEKPTEDKKEPAEKQSKAKNETKENNAPPVNAEPVNAEGGGILSTPPVTNSIIGSANASQTPVPLPDNAPAKPTKPAVPRYTYEEFKKIEKINNERLKKKEKELKRLKDEDHIRKTIENMKRGGIMC